MLGTGGRWPRIDASGGGSSIRWQKCGAPAP